MHACFHLVSSVDVVLLHHYELVGRCVLEPAVCCDHLHQLLTQHHHLLILQGRTAARWYRSAAMAMSWICRSSHEYFSHPSASLVLPDSKKSILHLFIV